MTPALLAIFNIGGGEIILLLAALLILLMGAVVLAAAICLIVRANRKSAETRLATPPRIPPDQF